MGVGRFVQGWRSIGGRLALVIWVFAGGGHTELKGLIIFLEKNFPEHRFKRYTPIKQKPGPKPGKQLSDKAFGKTGMGLAKQIRQVLPRALKQGKCDLILVLDDLDCRNEMDAAKCFKGAMGDIQETADIHYFIGFAAPEIEAWLIADWQDTFSVDYRFKSFHEGLRHCLSADYNVPFDHPESFSEINPATNACKEKLSDIIIEAVEFESQKRKKNLLHFSKKEHSPDLLRIANAQIIQQKCPIFSKLYFTLKNTVGK